MALTGKTIGQLTYLSGVTTDTLFPVELSGDTYQLAYSAFTNSNYNTGTYDELYSMATGGTLSAGSFYLMTDYQTCYDQPNFNSVGDPITTGNYKTGTTEPILLLATGLSNFAPTVYSTVYPQDKISYYFYFTETEVTNSPAKGRITERIDASNNRTDYDSREVQFIRYQGFFSEDIYPGKISIDGIGQVVSTGDTSFTTDFTVGDILGVYNNSTQGISCFDYYEILTITSNFNMTVTGTSISAVNNTYYSNGRPLPNYMNPYQCNIPSLTGSAEYYTFIDAGDGAWNNYIGDNNNITGPLPFKLSNNVFLDGAYRDNYFGGNCIGNTFNDDCDSNTIGAGFQFNIMTNDFDDNTIGTDFQKNIIDTDFNENSILDQFSNNMIGDENGDDFTSNVIGINFNRNFITISGVFNYNKIGDNFGSNVIDNDFEDNQILDGFQSNLITDNFRDNQIGNYFNYNIITNPFQSNQIGNIFSNNSILNSLQVVSIFENNIIYGGFEDNSISTIVTGNTFGLNCRTNIFGNNEVSGSINNNIIGSDFNTNTILSALLDNHIGNNFNNNDIFHFVTENMIGTYFQNNTIGISGQTGFLFSNNTTLGLFADNTFSGDTRYNTIGSNFTNNNIGQNFSYNKIGTNFQNNTIGISFGEEGGDTRGNTIGNFFSTNTIGDYFNDNQVSDIFFTNTVGNNFQLNNISAFNINGVDFTVNYGNINTISYVATGTTATDGVYTGIIGTYSGTGTGATFNITVGGGIVTGVTINQNGKLYLTGNTITIPGTSISGSTPADDVVITVDTISPTPVVYTLTNANIVRNKSNLNKLYYLGDSGIEFVDITSPFD
jgi:hypothetical protein